MNCAQLNNTIRALWLQTRNCSLIGSCFLKTDLGMDGCQAWLRQQILAGHTCAQKKQFGQAQHTQALIEKLIQAIVINWNEHAQSLVMFWDVHKQMLNLAFSLPVRLKNRVSVYRKPDIRPLLPLINPDQNCLVLLQTKEKLKMLDVDLGRMTLITQGSHTFPTESPIRLSLLI